LANKRKNVKYVLSALIAYACGGCCTLFEDSLWRIPLAWLKSGALPDSVPGRIILQGLAHAARRRAAARDDRSPDGAAGAVTAEKSQDHEWMDNSARGVKCLPSD
jgi:hypothetical protein